MVSTTPLHYQAVMIIIERIRILPLMNEEHIAVVTQ
jgi:hypothetical protein